MVVLTLLQGMGVGSLSMIVPMYNAEVAPPEVRGALVGLQQMAITTGIMISFWVNISKPLASTRTKHFDRLITAPIT